ncbi:homoserine dehydrogenase domain-containing protein [Ditylenchus destructor]|uniref:Homoserine dehydrogenase n=1 Tax=Ditylenchus destructor TaxID=166010 RepID=A0AAD4MII1_9BILA|nr:homoserine dehydrogenase domain-containing protein [Ditylenchus destructor]
MLITRRAGPGTPLEIDLQTGGQEEPKGSVRFKVGKATLSGLKDSAFSLDEAQIRTVLPELLKGDDASLTDNGGHKWVLSLAGLNAVLLKMDEVQGRVGTPGALVRRGNKPESSVLPPVQAPVVNAVLPTKARPGDDALAARIFPSLKSDPSADDCNNHDEFNAKSLTVSRLTERKVLLSFGCGMGAYNYTSVLWIANDKPPYAPVAIEANGDFDEKKRQRHFLDEGPRHRRLLVEPDLAFRRQGLRSHRPHLRRHVPRLPRRRLEPAALCLAGETLRAVRHPIQTLNAMSATLPMKPIQVGLLGAGTVGSGTFKVLKRNQEEIKRRAGRGIEIAMVADLDTARAREVAGEGVKVVSDAREVIANPEIDIVIELIGGYGIAKQLVLEAIAAGKHVVTANKALLAVHGTEIFAAAHARGVMVAFEAAVAGGIPIIKALREGLTANSIQWLAGIINGTTNFILSEMRDKGLDFATVLKEAQRLGYAEADPTFDIEGVDAGHKFDKAHIEGITKLAAQDIKYAEQLGYRIKLLGVTKRTAKGIELRVHPSLVPSKRLLANVEGAMNAVVVHGDAVGTTLYYGKGAGSEPTASAVIADLVDITRLHTADAAHRVPHLAFHPDALSDLQVLPMSEVVTSYYLRLRVADQAGVLAKVTGLLATAGISIDAVLQREADEVGGEGSTQTDLIILTHDAREGTVNDVLAELQALPTVLEPIVRIRKEELS